MEYHPKLCSEVRLIISLPSIVTTSKTSTLLVIVEIIKMDSSLHQIYRSTQRAIVGHLLAMLPLLLKWLQH
jgi:hypothetical protein